MFISICFKEGKLGSSCVRIQADVRNWILDDEIIPPIIIAKLLEPVSEKTNSMGIIIGL